MLGKRIYIKTTKNTIDTKYKFNINDVVFCVKDNVKNAKVLTRYSIKNEKFYKISNDNVTKIYKESDLIYN